MNALAIKIETLPSNPQQLAEISLVGGEFVDACIQKIRRIDKLGDAYNEKVKLLKEGQRVAILLFEVDKKIIELSKTIKSEAYKREIIKRNEKGQILGSKMVEEKGPRKWQKLGLTEHQYKTAQYVSNHQDIVDDIINKAIENDTIPTRTNFMSEIRNRRKRGFDEKEKMIDKLKRIEVDFLNSNSQNDVEFLDDFKKRIENILNRINHMQDIHELKNTKKTDFEIQAEKRLV